MTATDPQLAAMPAERLAPAAAALAEACAEDMSANPQGEGKRHERGVMPGQAAGYASCACRT